MEIAVELEGTPRIPPAHSILPKFHLLLWRPCLLRPNFGGLGIHLMRSFGALAL